MGSTSGSAHASVEKEESPRKKVPIRILYNHIGEHNAGDKLDCI